MARFFITGAGILFGAATFMGAILFVAALILLSPLLVPLHFVLLATNRRGFVTHRPDGKIDVIIDGEAFKRLM